MKQLAGNRLLSQWFAAATPGRLPERSSLDAVTLSAFMQNGLIAAIDGTAAGKIRAAGTRMGTVLPSALPGEAFLSLWRDHDRPAVARLVSRSVEHRLAMVCLVDLSGPEISAIALELLLLPVRCASTLQLIVVLSGPAFVPGGCKNTHIEPVRRI